MRTSVRELRAHAHAASRLAVLGSWLLAALACSGGERPRDALLVSIDTLRADRVGTYGYALARTPRLDALAARGARFTQAVSPAPITLPSHASLLTAKIPPFHGVRDNGVSRLHDAHVTLAERLRDGGFATGAFVGAYVLHGSFGLGQGFDVYDDRMTGRRSGAIGYDQRGAGEVVEAATAWLRELRPEQRFFAWVHFYDPHADYEPPPGFAAAMPGRPYDAEIAYVDFQLGQLLDVLAELGREDVLVAVTSDHGESLGEHGELTHTRFIYDATQRVPLILSGTGVPAGRVVDAQVRLIDVAPTLLDLLGLEPLPDVQGLGLRPLLRGETAPPRDAYLETLAPRSLGWSALAGIRGDGLKLIRAPRPELYDLAGDPGELANLIEARAAAAHELDRRLDALLDGAAAPRAEAPLDAAGRRRLEALGYVVPTQPHVGGAPQIGGVDPKDGVAAEAKLASLPALLDAGRFAEALELLGETRARFPDARFYLNLEAIARLRLGDADGAAKLASKLVGVSPADSEAWVLLSDAEAARGRFDAARAALDQAERRQPGSPLVRRARVSVEIDAGDAAAARRRLAAALAEAPGDLDVLVLRGRVAQLEGDTAAARRSHEEVLAQSPDHPDAGFELALLEIAAGELEAGVARLEAVPALRRASLVASLRLARAFAKGGDRERAKASLERFVRTPSERAVALDAYAALLLEEGEVDAAERHLRRALELEPGRLLAANNLASLLAREGRDLDTALRLARAVVEGAPGPLPSDTLAEVHLARDEPEPALAAAREGLKRAEAEGEEEALAHLRYLEGRALLALGLHREARSPLREAAEAAPEPPPAWAKEAQRLLNVAMESERLP